MTDSFLYKKSQGGLGMSPVWQMATSQLALPFAFHGYLRRPATQGSTEIIQFPLSWSCLYWSMIWLTHREALVLVFAVSLLEKSPKVQTWKLHTVRPVTDGKIKAMWFFPKLLFLSSWIYEKLGHFSWTHVTQEQRRYRQPLPEDWGLVYIKRWSCLTSANRSFQINLVPDINSYTVFTLSS